MTGTGWMRSPGRPSRPTISDSAGHNSEISRGRPPVSHASNVATASCLLPSVSTEASSCACVAVDSSSWAIFPLAWWSRLRTVPTGTSHASAIS
ncbi:hypothetical protein [Streptomyces sp. NPDC055749]